LAQPHGTVVFVERVEIVPRLPERAVLLGQRRGAAGGRGGRGPARDRDRRPEDAVGGGQDRAHEPPLVSIPVGKEQQELAVPLELAELQRLFSAGRAWAGAPVRRGLYAGALRPVEVAGIPSPPGAPLPACHDEIPIEAGSLPRPHHHVAKTRGGEYTPRCIPQTIPGWRSVAHVEALCTLHGPFAERPRPS